MRHKKVKVRDSLLSNARPDPLARWMAGRARALRAETEQHLGKESERGPLGRLRRFLIETAGNNQTPAQFSDALAQTLICSLVTARWSGTRGGAGTRAPADALPVLPLTNPVLEGVFDAARQMSPASRFAGILRDAASHLEEVDVEEPGAYGRPVGSDQDPLIHFYEQFLAAYDPARKRREGVYYTPRSAVFFIVESLDEILRERIGLTDGLADLTSFHTLKERCPGLAMPERVPHQTPAIQVLDPAAGTGVFLTAVTDRIYRTLKEKWASAGCSKQQVRERWTQYVPAFVLPRLHGFERSMAPYCIAHLNMGLKLIETGYRPTSNDKLRLHWMDTLQGPACSEPGLIPSGCTFPGGTRAKHCGDPLVAPTVIVGNPPYAGVSSNRSPWISALMEDYKRTVREEETQIRTLSDDYVKFFRIAQWYLERSCFGLLGFITNSGYLDGILFRDLRGFLLEGFERLWIYNLHGHGRRSRADRHEALDENIFPIRVGTAIALAERRVAGVKSEVFARDLSGTREYKLGSLAERTWSAVPWEPVCPKGPEFFFVPTNGSLQAEFDSLPALSEYWGTGREAHDRHRCYASGFKTQQDGFAIAPDHRVMNRRVNELLDPSTTEQGLRSRYRMCRSTQWSFDRARSRLGRTAWRDSFQEVLYRPFDERVTCYVPEVVSNPRLRVMSSLFSANIALLTVRQTTGAHWAHVFVTRKPADMCCLSLASKECSHVFPLYLWGKEYEGGDDAGAGKTARRNAAAKRSNLNGLLAEAVTRRLGFAMLELGCGDLHACLGPEDLFHYLYAIAHCTIWRERYREPLQRSLPRFPLPPGRALFRSLSLFGADLAALHLMEETYNAASWNRHPGGFNPFRSGPRACRLEGHGRPVLGRGFPAFRDEKVFINAKAWFHPVKEEVWRFRVGDYQVCAKWLRDRRRRKTGGEPALTRPEVDRFCAMVMALGETARIMREIDTRIERNGGWEAAFGILRRREEAGRDRTDIVQP